MYSKILSFSLFLTKEEKIQCTSLSIINDIQLNHNLKVLRGNVMPHCPCLYKLIQYFGGKKRENTVRILKNTLDCPHVCHSYNHTKVIFFIDNKSSLTSFHTKQKWSSMMLFLNSEGG